MIYLKNLVTYCNDLLTAGTIDDYCPNGLQVESGTDIKKVVTGVTASQSLIDKAIGVKADCLLVHHGYFWKNENQTLIGLKGERIKKLIKNNISLLAYHLPLDLHPVYGNNVLWGEALGWKPEVSQIDPLIWQTTLKAPISVEQLSKELSHTLDRQPLWLSGGNHQIQKIAWCSGAAEGYIEKAKQLGADAFMSGEVSEQTMHLAKELKIHYFSCGHHATEVFGVKALATHLDKKFPIDCSFINIDNPI